MGESLKFIPQPGPMRLGTVANNVADCVRALSLQLKLGNSCTRHELPTLGSNFKSWPSLPQSDKLELRSFYEVLKETMLDLWRDASGVACENKNCTWRDGLAISWLKQHISSVVFTEADKNLGATLSSRAWVDNQLLRHLLKYEEITPEQAQMCLQDKLDLFIDLVKTAQIRGIIKDGNKRFLLQNAFSKQLATLRLSIKVHMLNAFFFQ